MRTRPSPGPSVFRREQALRQLLDDRQEHLQNIERYYPAFAEQFDRRKNSRRLFQELWERWSARR